MGSHIERKIKGCLISAPKLMLLIGDSSSSSVFMLKTSHLPKLEFLCLATIFDPIKFINKSRNHATKIINAAWNGEPWRERREMHHTRIQKK